MNDPTQQRRALAEHIMQARFSITKFSPGYDLDQVDDFLDRVVRGLVQATIADVLEIISHASFKKTRWRDGYNIEQVDAFIGGLTEWLRGLDIYVAR